MHETVHLLERETELAAIDELIDADGGPRGVLLLEGNAGLGKTRLASLAAERCAALGLCTLWAGGGALEQDLAWGVVRGLFGAQLADRGRRGTLLEGAAASAAPLFGAGEPPSGPAATATILHGLYWLASDIAAECPLVVIVDDVHWADGPSAHWLSYLALRVADLPVALLLTARPQPRSPYWQAITTAPATRLLTLAPLSRAGTGALVAEELDGEHSELADACHAATGGNPFLLAELLHSTPAPDAEQLSPERVRALRPESIRRSVLLRLSELGDSASALCFAVAVLGQRATLALAGELALLAPVDAARIADELILADVIRVGTLLEFVHPLVRAVVEREMADAQRRDWHRRAARLLAQLGLPPSELAPHLLATEPTGDEEVVLTLRAAAAEALALGAPGSASACLARALLEPPPEPVRVDLLLELGQAEGVLADPAGVSHLREALGACSDPVKRAVITLALVRQLLFQGAIGEAGSLCDQAVRDLPESERELRLELLAHARVAAGQNLLTPAEDPPGIDPYQLAGATRGERMLLAACGNAVRSGARTLAERCELCVRALGETEMLDDLTSEAPQFWTATMTLAAGERYADVERHVAAAVADSRRRGSPRGYCLAMCFGSLLRYRLGDLAAAGENAVRALEISDGDPLVSTYALGFLLEALIDQGAIDAAREAVARVDFDVLPAMAPVARLRAVRGRLRRVEGDIPGAVEDLLIGAELLSHAGSGFMPWRADAALALLAAGERDRARELAREEVSLGERDSSRWVQARALHALALVEDALEPLERAELLTRDWPTRLERARVLVELGAGLRRRHRTGEAIGHLREGLDLADRCGATTIATRARDELRVAGARPRRAQISGRHALTPSEHRVCTMASDGMTNRDIAQALFVSLRTVETHLTHSYMKLAIQRREQLRVALCE